MPPPKKCREHLTCHECGLAHPGKTPGRIREHPGGATVKNFNLVTVPADELKRLIREAIAEDRASERQQQTADSAGLSLNAAARLARRRREVVAEALHSGALAGTRYGTNKLRPRWSVIAADVRTWLAAGCPTVKPMT